MRKKFYLVEEELTINDILVANYKKFRFLPESQRPQKIEETSTNWHDLFHLAADPDNKDLNLKLCPPTVTQSCYVRAYNIDRRFFKSNFKSMTHTRDVKVIDASTFPLEEICEHMPVKELQLLQASMLSYLWEIVDELKKEVAYPSFSDFIFTIPYSFLPHLHSPTPHRLQHGLAHTLHRGQAHTHPLRNFFIAVALTHKF